MSEIIKLQPYINGQYVESKTEKYTDAYNPSTGEVVAKVPCCTQEEVEMAIAAAKAAFPAWSATPVIKRVQILYKVRELLIEHMDELTELVATEITNAVAETAEERDAVTNKIQTAYVISGFTSVTILSVFIASFLAKLI